MIKLFKKILDSVLYCFIHFFDIKFRKRIRKRIIHFYLWILSFINLPPKILGLLIKICHFQTPAAIIFILFFCPKCIAYFFTIAIWWVVLIFFYLNGCFLTVVEYKLDNQDITMMDPIIYWCGDKITHQSRNVYSFFIGMYYLFCLMCIVKFRFNTSIFTLMFLFMVALFILIMGVLLLSSSPMEFFDNEPIHPLLNTFSYYKTSKTKTLKYTKIAY